MPTIAVFGANGRMGQMVMELATHRGYTTVPVDVDSDISSVVCDGIIDFSSGDAIDNIVTVATNNHCPVVSGTTALTTSQRQQLIQLSSVVPVVSKSNFSLALSTMLDMLVVATQQLQQYDWQLTELHHKGKADIPSGTALTIKDVVNACDNVLDNITSIRSGHYCGTHTVLISSAYESITITHTAIDRHCFAMGALEQLQQLIDNT